MRPSTLVPVVLSAGAIAAPAVLDKRVMETQVIVMTVTTTETVDHLPTNLPGGNPGDHHPSFSWTGYPSFSSPVGPPSSPSSTFVPSPPSSSAAPPPVESSPTTAAPPPPASSSSGTSDAPPAPSSSSSSSGGSPSSNGTPMIDTINKWRSAMSLSALTWSDSLAANSQKTVNDNNGGQGNSMTHELNSGSHAQVLGEGFENMPVGNVQYATGLSSNGQSWATAMGGMSPFELTYVAWLCEKPSAQGLSGTNTCTIEGNVLNSHNIEAGTGHYDILTGQYSVIGCAYAANPSANSAWPQMAGLWGCDLA
ncbi:MAG: hypothetical protein Q9227_009018 [Pyrenula ochraceoflavens]